MRDVCTSHERLNVCCAIHGTVVNISKAYLKEILFATADLFNSIASSDGERLLWSTSDDWCGRLKGSRKSARSCLNKAKCSI